MRIGRERLEEILGLVSGTRILVFGDFFLDQYWVTDPALEEISLETGHPANQVSQVRLSAGAAGTVANDVAALGAEAVLAMGIIGDDGNGLEVMRSLEQNGIATDQLIVTAERSTPTYTKPLVIQPDGSQVEDQRFDIKNRTPTPSSLEELLAERLRESFSSVDGVIVLDQVQEENCGSVTIRLREELIRLGTVFPNQPCLVDSRTRIKEFRSLLVKMNDHEAALGWGGEHASLTRVCRSIHERTNRPVIVTRGEQGVVGYDGKECREIPAVRFPEPLDIVGAGDAFSAAFLSAFAATGDFWGGIELGILASAVTVRKIGTTGTASAEEILRLWENVVPGS